MAYQDYGFPAAGACHMHHLILPALFALSGALRPELRVLDVGCGNGFTAGQFLSRGCQVVGVDLSEQGIELARSSYPSGRFEVLPADHSLLANLGCPPFDLVVSTEVIEHLYAPSAYLAGCYGALRAGGRFVLSTPYHGYLKNLCLSLADKWDAHLNPLWEGGHIKLWSRRTLARALSEAGFADLQFRGVGRYPWLWMSMLMAGTRPALPARP